MKPLGRPIKHTVEEREALIAELLQKRAEAHLRFYQEKENLDVTYKNARRALKVKQEDEIAHINYQLANLRRQKIALTYYNKQKEQE